MKNKIEYKKYWRKSSLKQGGVGVFFLNEILKKKPKHFLEIGVFHGVTSRNVCDLLQQMHGKDFSFTGIDLFTTEKEETKDEIIPQVKFSNPLKTIYYKYIVRLDPYSKESVERLLSKHKDNINIIKGNSNKVLKEISLDRFDFVFLDGGHKYETVLNDLKSLTKVVVNKGVVNPRAVAFSKCIIPIAVNQHIIEIMLMLERIICNLKLRDLSATKLSFIINGESMISPARQR